MKLSFEEISAVFDHAKSYPGLQIIPIRAKQEKTVSAPKMLWEGIESQSIKIEELKSSSVPEVQLTNETEDVFLGYRGTIIRGGGQNRQILHSFVVPKKSTIKIPVQCIQKGRWNPHQSKHFTSKSQDVTSSSVRFGKKSQGQTWSMIEETSQISGTSSPTMDYTTTNDILYGSAREYETAMAFTRRRGVEDEELQGKAREKAQRMLHENEPLPDQIGVYIQVLDPLAWREGQTRFRQCMEVFSSPQVYAKVHKDILSSFITDAVAVRQHEEELPRPELNEEQIQAFLKRVHGASWKPVPKIGSEEREEIIEAGPVFGESIYHENELVHMMCSID